MGDAPLTVGSWALGRRLARYRDERDLTGTAVAKALGVSQPTVTRIEKGKHRLTTVQLKKLCKLYSVTRDEAAELESARVLAQQPDWRQDYGRLLDGPLGDVLGIETGARRIRMHSGELVPGLLQTEEYTTALMVEAPYIRATEVKRRVELRMRRQEGVISGSQELVVTLGEAAVREAIGGPAVMRRQLAHLREQAAKPNIMIRLKPFAAGAHAALGSPFSILEFDADMDLPTVVAVETMTSVLIYEQTHQVETYTQSYDMLMAKALGEVDTIEHLEKIGRNTK
ncbi:MAG TPA: helix-turn-helix transcriptional regulator [Actinophytocola sp.]|jgi:transcriptional regulator with XRE-family HTH domain|uniref:helix-turn-helix domain-containing protein n=1 Tax=Actinophytocola sp. TaxID=1872138 RepID=UPI002E073281|nr:helix-turn-helix transcriptional regulator [Actinophytocola sp.]